MSNTSGSSASSKQDDTASGANDSNRTTKQLVDWKKIHNKLIPGEASPFKMLFAASALYLVGLPVSFGLLYPAAFAYHGIRSLGRLIQGKKVIDLPQWPPATALQTIKLDNKIIPFEKRKYDIVVFGATGYAGGLTAKYLATHYGTSIKWAIAGRNTSSLEKIRDELSIVNAGLKDLPLIAAKIDDQASLDQMVRDTKVVLTTVGPFAWYGTELVKACVENGTSYCDACGEPDWINMIIDRYDAAARKTGAKIVNMTALYSVPWDMLTLKSSEFIKSKGNGEELAEISFFNEMKAGPSGGTLASGVANFPPKSYKSPFRDFSPYETDEFGNLSPFKTIDKSQVLPGYSQIIGKFSNYFFMSKADYKCIQRSNALNGYGKELVFREAEIAPNFPTLLVKYLALPLVAGLFVIPPLRDRILLKSGVGPTEEELNDGFLQVTCQVRGTKGTKLEGRIYFNADPAFKDTARILVESGMSIVSNLDQLKCGPNGSGVLTPATCQGTVLLDRLIATGTKFDLHEVSS